MCILHWMAIMGIICTITMMWEKWQERRKDKAAIRVIRKCGHTVRSYY